MRRAARVDANHALIVAGLRTCGARVLSLAAVGHGCPDLLVSHHARGLQLFEVKDGMKAKSKQALTPDQVAFHVAWPVVVVNSVEQAIAALTTGSRE